MLSSPRVGCTWGTGYEDEEEKGHFATLRLRSAVQFWDLEVTQGMPIRLSLLHMVKGCICEQKYWPWICTSKGLDNQEC